MAPPLEDGFAGLTGSSTLAETGCTDLQLIGSSVADGRLPSTDLTSTKTNLQITKLIDFLYYICVSSFLSTHNATNNNRVPNVLSSC